MTNNLQTGGTERQFAALARALPPDSFRLELGCLRRTGAFLREVGDISEFDVGGSFFSFQAQRARLALARHLRAKQIAIAHSFDFYSNLMLIPVARLAGVTVVIGSQRQLGDLLSPLKRATQNELFRLCDCVTCNSQAAAKRLLDLGLPKHKLVVISNGLPAEAFAEAAPALPQHPGVLRLGLIARMNNSVKNQAHFLRAAARLVRKFPTVEFLLVGDGRFRQELESMARELGLGGQAKFLGERQDIPAVLAAMDISVVVSVSESLSNVILESMAAGKPVIATNVGGNTELIREGETGFLVPPNDEGALVEALECLLTQPARRTEYGEKGRQRARAEFSMDRARDLYEQLYLSLLAEKRRRVRMQEFVPVRDAVSPPAIRVAMVAPSLRMMGGQAVQANLLMKLWQKDPEVEVRFIPINPELPRPLAWVEQIPFLRTLIRTPFYLAALWRGIRDAEIVHIFSASYWSFLLAPVPAWLLARLRRKKALINYHSGEARDHLARWRSALPILRRVDQLVVPSGYLVDVFREYGVRARAVPNIVDLTQFSFRHRQPLRPRLVCTRGFEPYYGLDLVVRAFAEIKKEYPQASLCLVGDGTLEPQIRALVRELKLADVEFAGCVARDHIGRFYDEADIFINASWLDNMPGSILEAFASGTPVVSTAPEGIRYVVAHERTGLLCEPGDWHALAGNVLRLMREPNMATRVSRSAYEESGRYRWDRVRSQWLEIYRSLLNRTPGAASREVVTTRSNSTPSEPEHIKLSQFC